MAEKIPEKPKEIYRPATQQTPYHPKPGLTHKAPEKSFQSFMDTIQQGEHEGVTNPQQATRDTPKPVQSHDERREGTKDDQQKKTRERDFDREEKVSSRSSKDDGGSHAKVAEKKVVGHHSLSERSRQGQEKGGDGRGFGQGKEQRRNFAAVLRTKGAESEPKFSGIQKGENPFAQVIAEKRAAAATTTEQVVPREISKAMMDQIVQYVRLMTKVDGEKEMELALHEKVFKGLRLKVTLQKGKLDATFSTRSPEVQKFFESQTGALRQALSEKGIDINSLTVTMD